MFEPTRDQLVEEREELAEHEASCVRIADLIEENQEIEMSPYLHKVSLATLNRVADVIQHRIHTINDELEQIKNKPLDNFTHRRLQ